jgi:hypothetical protein
MAPINTAAASVTALFKYYHSDRTKFYPAVSTANAYADDFFAVTIHSDNVANSNAQTIIRFHVNTNDVTISYALRDPTDTAAPAAISGSTVGDLERLGDRIFYSNYEDEVKMAKVRNSAGDTDANILYKAGIPDPNAVRVISRCQDTANWTFSAGGGAGAQDIDRSPTHRLHGDAALRFTQTTNGKTSTLTFQIENTADRDLTSFADGSSSSATDFIAFNVFRYDKQAIKALKIMLATDTAAFTNYYFAPLAEAEDTNLRDEEDSATWSQWDFQQNTAMAQWGINPYDNQMFRVRIRKSWFAMSGSPAGWSAVSTVRIALEADSQASASNPARISINDITLAKSPPIGKEYRIQWSSFEEQDPNSTNGWLTNTATLTRATFNRQMTKEGVSCLVISGGQTTAHCSIEFDTGQDFVTFPDGVTANTACVLSMNAGWKGLDAATVNGQGGAWPTVDWVGSFTAPRLRFYSGGAEFAGGNYVTATFGMGTSLRGGGLKKSLRFDPDGSLGLSWVKTGTGVDWTDVTRIDAYGPRYVAAAAGWSYYVDDLRLEWPQAAKIVNAFEPLDLIGLDAADTWADTNLKDYAWVVDWATDAAEFLLKTTRYKTYGYGHATYPDYEHSSLGIAGCTLRVYGSKPFGMTIQRDPTAFGGDIGINLDEYKIPVMQMPPVWDLSNDQYGFIKYETIPNSLNDKFKIWVASPDPSQINEIKIRFHGNDSSDADLNNYYEYTITGQELYEAMKDMPSQANLDQLRQLEKQGDLGNMEDVVKADLIIRGLQDRANLTKSDLIFLTNYFTHPYGKQEIQGLFKHSMEYLGRDRGGWPSAIFEWEKKDMLLVRSGEAGKTPDWSDIRGQTVEVSGTGNEATVCFDNLTMMNYGSLKGEYYYKVGVEDEDGYMSNTSEPSLKVVVDNKDVVLTDIFIPNAGEQQRVEAKKIFRIGGKSTEWRHVGDLAVDRNEFYDQKKEDDLGFVMPEDAFAPPKAKVIKAIGNNMYYGNCVNRLGETFPYRMYRSEPFCAYRVKDFSSIDIPETMGKGITGIEQYYNHIIIWTPDSMWTTNMGLTTPPIFRANKGCIARRSIAYTDRGLIWLSRDGLMLGNISGVDDQFFLPVNSIFESYTEDQLENSIGFVKDKYYYLFYDQTNRKGICCYLPDRLFSELTGNDSAGSTVDPGPFDVHSVSLWRGNTDADTIYYGRSNGEIFQMFEGEDDNGTAIWTHVRTKDFNDPGIQFDKSLAASYWSIASLHTATYTPTITPAVYCNQTAKDTMPVISAVATSFRTFVGVAQQGDLGQFIGVEAKGLNRHKIAQITMKIEPKPDNEYISNG